MSAKQTPTSKNGQISSESSHDKELRLIREGKVPSWVAPLKQLNIFLVEGLLGGPRNYWMYDAINAAKGLTLIVVLNLMFVYDNWSLPAISYLVMHGSYAVLWVAKDYIFPDSKWRVRQTLASHIFTFCYLTGYWIPPFLLITSKTETPTSVCIISLFAYIIGVSLMLVSDAQKYYTLLYKPGLIMDGVFAWTRNPNYLGEMMVYGAFALVSYHLLSWPFLLFTWGGTFLPNMLLKDASMSRYPEWPQYAKKSGFLLPRVHLKSQ